MKLTCALAMVLLVPATYAGVALRIVDHPAHVLSFCPIPIIVEVRNDGDAAARVWLEPLTSDGVFLEHGADLETLQRHRGAHAVYASGACGMLLRPGEARYLRFEISESAPERGRMIVRAGLQNSERIHRQCSAPEGVAAWVGEAWSEPVTIDVSEPVTSVDREALAFIQKPLEENRMAGSMPFRIRTFFSLIHERYPLTEYSYAAAIGSTEECPRCIEIVMKEQPGHPLERFALLRMILFDDHEGTVVPAVEKLPESLRGYARQQLEWIEARKAEEAARSRPDPVAP